MGRKKLKGVKVGGTQCCVAACRNNRYNTNQVAFHRFPKEEKLRKRWIRAARRSGYFNPDTSYICSDHFILSDYDRDLRNELLAMYDEEVDLGDVDEVQSSSTGPDVYSRMEMHAEMRPKQERPQSANKNARASAMRSANSFVREMDKNESSESDNSDDDDEDVQGPSVEGYTPQTIDLEYKLQVFVPEYIPAVGDIDGFIKVNRPDGVDDQLGIVVLDEPSITQSEPAVMHLRLRAATKQSSAKQVVVKKLKNADKNPKAIEKWIQDIGELHKTKPAPTIQYSRPMPEIDNLMQEWPPEFEQKLNEVGLPLEELEVDLLTYVDIVCALFDIPRYESRIESLHVLFSLYSAVRNYKNTNEEDGDD